MIYHQKYRWSRQQIHEESINGKTNCCVHSSLSIEVYTLSSNQEPKSRPRYSSHDLSLTIPTGKTMKYTHEGSCYWIPYFLHEHRGYRNYRNRLTLMLLVANSVNTKWSKKPENYWNCGKWVLIWEYSARAIQWIPTWQGFDGFQKFAFLCLR